MPSLEKATEREEKKCPHATRLFVLNCRIIKLHSEMSKMGKTHQIATKSSALIDWSSHLFMSKSIRSGWVGNKFTVGVNESHSINLGRIAPVGSCDRIGWIVPFKIPSTLILAVLLLWGWKPLFYLRITHVFLVWIFITNINSFSYWEGKCTWHQEASQQDTARADKLNSSCSICVQSLHKVKFPQSKKKEGKKKAFF